MATIKARKITIGGKEYEMPKIPPMKYMDYLDVRDSVMDTEGKRGLYTRKQFENMVDSIVDLYGNQFTAEELLDAENGLSVGEIIMEFAAIDVSVGAQVNDQMEDFTANFTDGK